MVLDDSEHADFLDAGDQNFALEVSILIKVLD